MVRLVGLIALIGWGALIGRCVTSWHWAAADVPRRHIARVSAASTPDAPNQAAKCSHDQPDHRENHPTIEQAEDVSDETWPASARQANDARRTQVNIGRKQNNNDSSQTDCNEARQ